MSLPNVARAKGRKAALGGALYSANPFERGTGAHLEWAKGHNESRAHALHLASLPYCPPRPHGC